jgi:hypothetical protein
MMPQATRTALHFAIATAVLAVGWSPSLAQQTGRAELYMPENCVKTHWAFDCDVPRQDLIEQKKPSGSQVPAPRESRSDVDPNDPHRCISEPIWMQSHLGPSCTMYAVYNHCSRPVHIKTCSYRLEKRNWDCEVQTGVKPNERKTHTNCSPIRERHVDVIWADDRRSRLPDPPLPKP